MYALSGHRFAYSARRHVGPTRLPGHHEAISEAPQIPPDEQDLAKLPHTFQVSQDDIHWSHTQKSDEKCQQG